MSKLKNYIINRLPAESFFKNVMTLMSGTVIAQGMVLLCTPILTRLYSPEAFGALTVFTAVTSILSVISCGRYELGIVLPEDDTEASNLLILSLIITILTTLLVVVGILIIYQLPISFAIDIKKTSISWIWYVPLSLFVTGLYQALNYWATRKKQFGRLAVRQITQAITMTIVQLIIGWLIVANGISLIIGLIIGQTTATGLMLIQTWKEDGNFICDTYNYKTVKRVAFCYRKFPLYTIWASLLNALSPQLPVFFLSAVSLSASGYFGLATRVVGLPMSLIGNSVSQVFFADASEELIIQGSCVQIFRITVRRLLGIGVLFSILVLIVSYFMDTIFGSQWDKAGIILIILIPMFFVRFISSPVSSIYYIRQKQDWDLYITLVFAIIPILAFTVSKQLEFESNIAIALYSVFMALAYGIQLLFGFKLTYKE